MYQYRCPLVAPQVGLEPTTLRLTAECSAIELLRIILLCLLASFFSSPAALIPLRPFRSFSLCPALPAFAVRAPSEPEPFLFPLMGQEREKLPFPPLHFLDPGNVLLSQAVPSSVPSACGGLTSVFGMGTGGSLQPLSPETFSRFPSLPRHFRRFRLPHPQNCTATQLTSKLTLFFSSDQALDLLVSPSSTRYRASTDDLSTSSSLRGLTCFKQWQSSSSGGLHA